MSRHDPWVSVQDMLDHAEEAVTLANGIPRESMDRKATWLWLASSKS